MPRTIADGIGLMEYPFRTTDAVQLHANHDRAAAAQSAGSTRRPHQIRPPEYIAGHPTRRLKQCGVAVGAAEKLQAER